MGEPLKIDVGRSFTWEFGPILNEAGEPLDLSGSATGDWFVLRRKGDPTSIILHQSSALTRVSFIPQLVGNATQYSMQVTIEPDDTQGIVMPGLYFHEAVIVDATGHKYNLSFGDGNLIQFNAALPFPLAS